MITLVAVSNPFQPTISREVHEVEWREAMTLADALEAAGVPTLRHTCVIDGLVVPEEMLAGFPVADGVTVIAMPTVGGGGFGKMMLQMSIYAAALAATILVPGVGGLAIGAAISMGGNLLISAFFGPGGGGNNSNFNPQGPSTVQSGGTPIPKGYGTFLSGGNVIASYVSAEGVDDYCNVLVSYGWGPATEITGVNINKNSIQNYAGTTYFPRLGTNTQPPILNFNNIVNGYPQDIRAVALAGTIGTGADPGTPIVIQGTGNATQGLQVVIQMPDGCYYQNDDGSLRALSISWQVQYSVGGENNWQNPVIPDPTMVHDVVTYTYDNTILNYPNWVVVPTDANYSSGIVYDHDNDAGPTAYYPGQPWTGTQTVTYYNADGSSYQGPITLTGEWQRCDPYLNQQIVYGWLAGYVIFTACQQGTLYHTTNIMNLPPNRYDVRVTKYGNAFANDFIQPRESNNSRTGDQTWVWSVNEIQYQDLAYPNMILCGVHALSTGQVSGANISITAQVTYGISVTLPAALAGYGTDNPAVVAYDMLCAEFYGGGINPANIDVPAFVTWASYNDELVSDGFGGTIKRHVFNGIFDGQGTNLWKSLQRVAMMSQATILQIGQTYTVIVDMPVSVPAQVFTSGNVIRDSIKDTWMSFDDRANRIEVSFADAARNYRTDEPCAVMLPKDIQAGVEVKTTRVKLLGCTNRAQAWHWAYRKLMATDLLLLSRSFDVGIEAVACQVGSVIGIQDDVTAYCNGGRIQAGSNVNALIVDVENLEFTAGAGWTASVVHPVVVRGTGVIQSIIGNVITFTGTTLPQGNLSSIENAAGNVGVIQFVGAPTITVASTYGFAAGQAVTFYDQDVVDTQPIGAVTGNILTPLAPFLQAPTPDAPWVYGQSAGAFPAKLFTVTNIRRKGDLQVTIDCLEYNPAVYADDTPIITETLAVPVFQAAVTNLLAVENYTMANGANGGQASIINVSWQNGAATQKVELWVARNEAGQALSAENLVLTVNKASSASLTYPTGSIIQIRAVGVDGLGGTAPYLEAPVVTITVQGSGMAPGDVPSIAGTLSPTGTALTWGAASNAATYEVRYNPDISNSNWQAATLVYSGAATSFTDTTPRQGLYLVKAISSATVESVHTISWNYLHGPARLNLVGLQAGQTPSVYISQNVVSGSSVTLTMELAAQTLYRADGSAVQVGPSTLTFPALAENTAYVIYPYIDQASFAIHSGAGDTAVPDTAANATSAAAASAGTNYACPVLNVTTAGSSGTGTGAAATFSVQTSSKLTAGTGTSASYYAYTVNGVTITSGGSGYTTAPTGSLVGYMNNGTSTASTSIPLTFTVSGGAVTAVDGWASSGWTQPPHVVLG